jgi:phosphotransferase system HPr (HPr) family protein
MQEQLSRTVVVKGRQGLHARPADLFVKVASRYQSQVEIQKGSERVDGKSILNVLTLAAEQGCALLLVVTGPDAAEALHALAELVESNFGEPEAEAFP